MTTLLLTGASGFLGRMLRDELQRHYRLLTLGRSAGNDLVDDLAKGPPVLPGGIDLVVHNAGKAHVLPRTEAEARAFFKVNHEGTVNLLKALARREAPPRQLVLISTVAVYGRDAGEGITESHPLGGKTPYARSKILAEEAVLEWGAAAGVPVVILRLPLVAGPEPPGNLGAIRRAVARGYYVRIKGNTARKSIVRGDDVARLIPALTGKAGVFNLTDGVHPSFAAIEEAIAKERGKPIRLALPLSWLTLAARVGDRIPGLPLSSQRLAKMTASLTFDDSRARRELEWRPGAAVAYIEKGGLEGRTMT